MGMEVITIEAWAVLASIVAVISPVIVVLVKSTNIWAKLDLTVTNLSKAIADLSSLIKELQVGQSNITQRIIKLESATEVLEEREHEIEKRLGQIDRRKAFRDD